MVIRVEASVLESVVRDHAGARDLRAGEVRKAARLTAALVTERRGEVVDDGTSSGAERDAEVVAAWARLQAASLLDRLAAGREKTDLLGLLRDALAATRSRRSRARRFVELDECRQLVGDLARGAKLRGGLAEVEDERLLAGAGFGRELLRAVAGAHQQVLVSTFYFRLEPQAPGLLRELVDVLARAADSCDTRVLLDSRASRRAPTGEVNHAAVEALTRAGVAVRRWQLPDRRLHAKFAVVDGRRVFAGSHNLTAGSLYRHGDLGLALAGEALAQRLIEEFERLWRVAGDYADASPAPSASAPSSAR